MEEIVVPEDPPRLVSAVALDLADPRHAQALLQAVNRLYPFTADNASEHLKRIRKRAADAGGDGGRGPPMLEVLVELLPGGHPVVAEQRDSPGSKRHRSEGGDPIASGEEEAAPLRLEDSYGAILAAAADLCGVARSDAAATFPLHLVAVPDRAPRQSPEAWTEWTAVWPFAVPKPHAPETPSSELVGAANALMREVVLPLAVGIVRDRPYLLGIAAVVVDGSGASSSEGGEGEGSLPRVLVTSEKCGTMDRGNPNAWCAYCPSAPSTAVGSGGGAATAVATDAATAAPQRPRLVLEHPIMYALKKLAALQSGSVTCTVGGSDTAMASTVAGNPPHSGTALEAARQCGIAARRPYLANQLDLYVTHEPCVMCAMALIHSRVARVFYCFPNPVHGGVGSVFAVHAVRSLNHHYRAYHCAAAEAAYAGPRLL